MNRVVISPLEVADDAEPPDGKPVQSLPSIAVAPLQPKPAGLKVVRSRHVVSERSRAFLKRHFPQASLQEWNDWRWQNRNRVRKIEQLERMVTLSDDERDAIQRHQGALPVGAAGQGSVRKRDIDGALEYLEQHSVVRDVLISGGDPLSMDEERLDYILGRLQRIPHLEFVGNGQLGLGLPQASEQGVTSC